MQTVSTLSMFTIFGEVAVGKVAVSLLAVMVQAIRGFESLPSPPSFIYPMRVAGTLSQAVAIEPGEGRTR
jgi:hypothetical protein